MNQIIWRFQALIIVTLKKGPVGSRKVFEKSNFTLEF